MHSRSKSGSETGLCDKALKVLKAGSKNAKYALVRFEIIDDMSLIEDVQAAHCDPNCKW